MAAPEKSLKHGFTLVEILVVLSIIALLGAILLPVLARVRENGRSDVCREHLKQIALGMQPYVQDFDGRYPDAGICHAELRL